MFTVKKSYRDFPAAHRQPKHDGHCRLIHGHNWGFDILFTCDALDENGFVVDVGKLKTIKDALNERFDHTLLLNLDDPYVPLLTQGEMKGLAKVFLVPNCGMEGLAKFVHLLVSELIDAEVFDVTFERNLRVLSVTCWEDSKNSATYVSPANAQSLEESEATKQ